MPHLIPHLPNRTLVHALALATATVLVALTPLAHAQQDEASLERAGMPDTTPQQRYQSAIREAGGGLKVSLAECRALPKTGQKACTAQAQQQYQADMATAKAMLRNPEARPINITGEPVRGTETPIILKP